VHRSCPSVCPFVRLLVCLSVAKMQKNAIFSKSKQFKVTVSIGVAHRYGVAHGLFKESITGPLKSKSYDVY